MLDVSLVTTAGRPFAGLELGGTKCVCTLAHGPGAVLEQRTVPTTRPEETLPAILAILEEWEARGGFSAIGLASFGPIDLDPASLQFGRILATPKPGWPGTDVFGMLAAPFAVPAAFDTDVNVPLSRKSDGAAGRGCAISPMLRWVRASASA